MDVAAVEQWEREYQVEVGDKNAVTLVVDCGGTGIKAGLVDCAGQLVGEPVRFPTPYPLSPELLMSIIAGLVHGGLAHFAQPEGLDLRILRVTVGLPGMIRHGVIVHTPHYITNAGPHTAIVPELQAAWAGFDFQSALRQRLGLPVRVLNDAELHGYGVITGQGLELVLTLGTGLGSAWYDDGALAPHLEISHAPVRLGAAMPGNEHGRQTITYDGFIGDAELRRLGVGHWSDRVEAAIASLKPVFWWDRLYLGGGNSARIVELVARNLGDDVTIVPNESALIGGAKLWHIQH